ncbi:MAG: hypothetical protein CMJ18_01150 [Phycisphaeraceae bacterium]|nr:hypothetical protein [Phycisphaeraceae bacterium]
MFFMTIAALYCGLTPVSLQPIEPVTGWSIVAFALWIVIGGCVITTGRRLIHIARRLRNAT